MFFGKAGEGLYLYSTMMSVTTYSQFRSYGDLPIWSCAILLLHPCVAVRQACLISSESWGRAFCRVNEMTQVYIRYKDTGVKSSDQRGSSMKWASCTIYVIWLD